MRSREGMAMTLPVRQKKQKKLRPNWRIAVLARGKTNRQGWNHAELNTPSGSHRRRWYCRHTGVYPLARTRRAEESLIPVGVRWIRNAAQTFEPEKNTVHLNNGDTQNPTEQNFRWSARTP